MNYKVEDGPKGGMQGSVDCIRMVATGNYEYFEDMYMTTLNLEGTNAEGSHPDESEIGLARMIASLRTCNNRVAKVQHNVRIKGQDNFTNDLLGVCGEMVFAKTFNIYLDLCFHNRSGGS